MSRSVCRCASAGYRVFAEVAHVSTEWPLIDFSIFGTREGHPRMFQFEDGRDRLPAHIFDGILVAEPVGPLDRVVHVPLPTVFAEIAETGCNAALGCNRMTACRKHLCNAGSRQACLDGPCVARKPAPPAPTTTTSNIWSMNLYASARVEFMLFPDWLGLDADLQHGADARDEQEASS